VYSVPVLLACDVGALAVAGAETGAVIALGLRLDLCLDEEGAGGVNHDTHYRHANNASIVCMIASLSVNQIQCL
jgi:hypothetical protein